MDLKERYAELEKHLKGAYFQCSAGKGKARHANNDKWIDQKILIIPKLLKEMPEGTAALAYQVIKKISESGRIFNTSGKEAAIQEIYGAIVYACALAELVEQISEEPNALEDQSNNDLLNNDLLQKLSEEYNV